MLDETREAIQSVRERSGGCILFCSLGKDSLALLDLVYPYFERVVCVFMYFVRGLEHIERRIGWLKAKYPGIEFVQVPHWNLTYILRGGLYCVPNPRVRLLRLADVVRAARLRYGIRYVFLGMKKADSMNRRLMLGRYVNRENDGLVYPLADWTQRDVLGYMRQHGLPELIRYSLKASSGTGFNLDCMLWMRENYLRDLERIYRVFPMSERVLWEYDNKNGTARDQADER